MSKTIMIKKFILLILVFSCGIGTEIVAQVEDLMGSDICADGQQSTRIGIAGANPEKYYALYHNDKLFQVRQSGVAGQNQMLTFGTFKEVGSYTAASFDEMKEGFPAKLGTPVKGKITISPVPVMYMGDTLKIKSGEPLNYAPRANLAGTTFTWTTSVVKGKVTGLSKKGNNAINETLQLSDSNSACIIYSITPHSPDQFASCSGLTRDLVVIIKP
jgi:hypothetical protein